MRDDRSSCLTSRVPCPKREILISDTLYVIRDRTVVGTYGQPDLL